MTIRANPSPTDNPIESSNQDRLGRSIVANDIAREILSLNASKGAVAAIIGPWGNGKTSFINLMREKFTEEPAVAVIDFNPWMFSGSEQLVDHFFVELAAKFKNLHDKRLSRAAKFLEKYGGSISSFVGVFGIVGRIFANGISFARVIAKSHREKYSSVDRRREDVAQELSKLEHPVIVIIDDIDRLTTPEIRDIFKLVRLTASFPNIIYILAFDRERVEKALDEENVPGRAYLEKIIQFAYDLPEIPDDLLADEVMSELLKLLDEFEIIRFDDSRWPDIFAEVIYPLIRNMRDVVRLALSVKPALRALAKEIEIIDLLAMETVRVLRPEVFAHLCRMRTALTQTRDSTESSGKNSVHQTQVDKLLHTSAGDSDLVKALLRRVFPAAAKYFEENDKYSSDWVKIWRKKHRMACSDFLGMYFDRVAPSGLRSFWLAESLVSAMNDPERFESELNSVPQEMITDVLRAVMSFENDFPEAKMDLVIASLANAIPRLPADQEVGIFFALRPDVIVMQVICTMLRQVEMEKREQIIGSALSKISSYSSKLRLIYAIGYRESFGSGEVSRKAAERFEEDLAGELEAAPPNNFSIEWNSIHVYDFISEKSGNSEVLAEERRPEAIRAILESAKSNKRSSAWGSRHITLTPTLAWEWLVKLFGNEDNLRCAIERLREVDGNTELVELANRYLEGQYLD